jgi:hypothetical protein
MNIFSIKLEINNGVSNETISPIYEVHSWEDAERIIMNTKALLADKPNSSFSFEVYGNHTTYIA